MSTTIKSSIGGSERIITLTQTRYGVGIRTAGENACGADVEANFTTSRDDLIAAVEAECGVRLAAESEPLAEWEMALVYPGQKLVPADAIVIERGGFSLATTEPQLLAALRSLGDLYGPLGVAKAAGMLLDVPPVDEAMVLALATLLVSFDPIEDVATTTIALHLYLAGVRIEQGEAAK